LTTSIDSVARSVRTWIVTSCRPGSVVQVDVNVAPAASQYLTAVADGVYPLA
jgi:hypothetical protein